MIARILMYSVYLLCFFMLPLGASSKFTRDKQSGTTVNNAATVKIKNTQKVVGGRVTKKSGGTIKGTLDIVDGVYEDEDGEDYDDVTASFDPSQPSSNLSNAAVKQLFSTINKDVNLSGNCSYEGVSGKVEGNKNINLANNTTTLNLAVSDPLGTNVNLNGGMTRLTSDVKMQDDKNIRGNGIIDGNGKTLETGGKPLTDGDKKEFRRMNDLIFNAKITLTGSWTFTGDSRINGNGNILDISQGGTIRVKSTTKLYLTDLTLKGLGLGKLLFDSKTAQIYLSNVDIEMDRNVTFTTGGIYVEGPTTILVKDKVLTFDQLASLTVDGVVLSYDTYNFVNNNNIQPLAVNDPGQAHLALLDGGIVRRVSTGFGSGNMHLTVNTDLQGLEEFHPTRKIFFDQSVTLQGATHHGFFSRADQPLIIVAAGRTARITNMVLDHFRPSVVSLAAGAQLFFQDRTNIVMGQDDSLLYTMTFKGKCILNGGGRTLDMSSTAAAIVLSGTGASLLIQNIILKNISGSKLRCLENNATVTFDNVTWIQNANYSFTSGRIDVVGLWDIRGTYTLTYGSNKNSTIFSGGIMKLDRGMTFSYAPASNNRDLWNMQDVGSVLMLNGASIASTNTGIRLRKGTLLVDHTSFLRSSAVSDSQAIQFGDGVGANDLQIVVMPSASLNLQSGRFVYSNAN